MDKSFDEAFKYAEKAFEYADEAFKKAENTLYEAPQGLSSESPDKGLLTFRIQIRARSEWAIIKHAFYMPFRILKRKLAYGSIFKRISK